MTAVHYRVMASLESFQVPVWFGCVAVFIRICYPPARSRGRIVGVTGLAFAVLVGTFVSTHAVDGACARIACWAVLMAG